MSELQHFTQVPLECESTRGTLAFGLSEFQISNFYKIFCNKNRFTRKQQIPLPHQKVQATSPTQATPAHTHPSGTHARELPNSWLSAPLRVHACELFAPWPSTAPRVHARELSTSWSSVLLRVHACELFAPWPSTAPRVHACELSTSWSSTTPSVCAHKFKRSQGNVTRRARAQLREAAALAHIDRPCLAVERWPVSYGAIPPGLISRQNPTEPRPRRGVRCIWGEQNEGVAMT